MRNILSYSSYTRFKGKEIKEWIKFHTENQTEYTKEAQHMIDYFNILDDVEYYVRKGDSLGSLLFCLILTNFPNCDIINKMNN